jgi:sugar phosphate permease
MYAYYLIDTWLPNFLETERGFSGASIGIASSLVFFAAIPGALAFSRIADKHPHRKVPIIVGLELIAAAMLLFMITTTNSTLLIIGIIAYGFFGKLAVEPIIISWMSGSGSGGSLATMYGFFNFFGMMSSVIAPTVTGAISDFAGTKIYGFYLAIIIILIGTGIFYFVNRKSETDGSVGQIVS